MYKILTINPGSTSTKIAIYHDENEVFIKTIRHQTEELAPFERVADEFEFRRDIIIKELKNEGFNINEFDLIVGRGGLIAPIPSGVFEVNENMKQELREAKRGEHASNLGALIADDIAKEINKNNGNNKVKAVIVDPVVVDEMNDVARISGHPLFPRLSIFHALNQKAIARLYAKENKKKYEDLNLIVVHLGGGISVGAHCKGKVIDTNDALNGEGPFSPQRSGGLTPGQIVEACYSGKYTKDQMKLMVNGEGGLVAHLGTNSALEVEQKAEKGEAKYKLIQDALCYGTAKMIGAMATVLKGKVDAIILTGGIAYNKYLVEYVKDMVGFIAPISVYPGEDEMKALAINGLMMLKGEIKLNQY